MNIKIFYALSLMGVLLITCKKEDNSQNDPCYNEIRNKLCSGFWRPVSLIWSGVERIDSCELDDSVFFTASGSYIRNYGVIQCTAQSTPFQSKYDISSCNTITLAGGNVTILKITEDSLRLQDNVSIFILGKMH